MEAYSQTFLIVLLLHAGSPSVSSTLQEWKAGQQGVYLWAWAGDMSPLINSTTSDSFFAFVQHEKVNGINVRTVLLEHEQVFDDQLFQSSTPLQDFVLRCGKASPPISVGIL